MAASGGDRRGGRQSQTGGDRERQHREAPQQQLHSSTPRTLCTQLHEALSFAHQIAFAIAYALPVRVPVEAQVQVEVEGQVEEQRQQQQVLVATRAQEILVVSPKAKADVARRVQPPTRPEEAAALAFSFASRKEQQTATRAFLFREFEQQFERLVGR